jgi:hypothetical protein
VSELSSEMRVQTYLTLLCTLTLSRTAGHATELLETLSKGSWHRLREVERYRIDLTIYRATNPYLSVEHRRVTLNH